MKIINALKFIVFKKIWKYKNRHNDTTPDIKFTLDKVSVGNGTYGYLHVREFGNDSKLKIGNYCSIADKVVFLLGGEHNYNRISSFPFKNYYFDEFDAVSNGDIIIEDDVWIGYDSLILSGVTIGKGSIIGARSIVTKDVPPYSIYVGNKVIKKRFSDDVIQKLLKLDFSKLDSFFIKNNKEIFESDLTEENIDEFIKKINSIK